MAAIALFIGLNRDPHIREVAKQLNQLGIQTEVLDPTNALQFSFNPTRPNQIELGGINFHISAIWWRWKPGLLSRLKQEQPDLDFDDQTEAEWLAATKAIWSINSEVAVNKFSGHLNFNNKINQLNLASNLGFSVPDTRVCNSKKSCMAFVANGPAIIKPLIPASFETRDQGTQPYSTATLNTELVEECTIEEHRSNASFIQTCIERKAEIRVNYLFGRVFARRFIPESIYNFDPSIHADWRPLYNFQGEKGDRGEIISLPPECIASINKYAKHTGMQILCFDFAEDIDGTLYFLEANPDGQWLWLCDQEQQILAASSGIAKIADGSRSWQ